MAQSLNHISIKINFPRIKRPGLSKLLPKLRLHLLFNYGAWFNAYSILNVEPDGFDKVPQLDQYFSMIYGAAVEYCIVNKKRIYFDFQDIKKLNFGIKEMNKISTAMKEAQLPDWMVKLLSQRKQWGKEAQLKKKSA